MTVDDPRKSVTGNAEYLRRLGDVQAERFQAILPDAVSGMWRFLHCHSTSFPRSVRRRTVFRAAIHNILWLFHHLIRHMLRSNFLRRRLLLCIDLSTALADNGPSLLRNPDWKGIERRWITLLSAGWLPHDFTSSRSCLTLGSWVARPCGRVHIGASRVLQTGLRRPGFHSRDTLHILGWGRSRRIRRLHACPCPRSPFPQQYGR